MAGRLERWDERNQRWADRMLATPPPEPDLRRLGLIWAGLLALDLAAGLIGARGLVLYVGLAVWVVLAVRARRRRRA